ncbi:unnamed protein product, partial [Cochlearia groenlandica]
LFRSVDLYHGVNEEQLKSYEGVATFEVTGLPEMNETDIDLFTAELTVDVGKRSWISLVWGSKGTKAWSVRTGQDIEE